MKGIMLSVFLSTGCFFTYGQPGSNVFKFKAFETKSALLNGSGVDISGNKWVSADFSENGRGDPILKFKGMDKAGYD